MINSKSLLIKRIVKSEFSLNKVLRDVFSLKLISFDKRVNFEICLKLFEGIFEILE